MKKYLKKIITSIFIAGLAAALFAQANENKNAIGVYIIGLEYPVGGIQYEHSFTDTFSEKFGIMAYYDSKQSVSPFFIQLSTEADYKLYETELTDFLFSKLYIFALAGYHAYQEADYEYGEGFKPKPLCHNAVAALGFGFDFIFFDHLSVPLQFGFMGNFPNKTQLGFCMGTGLRYCW